ncbi:MAG TPA: hypothetical protein VLG47_05025 [Candidatus Saccharimonadales bacterium]|nr:hypothetical protein [Candidatus Saccharimonadales bacterium]
MSKKIKRKSKNTDAWFIKIRGSYLPNSWQGWLTYIPFVGYLVLSFSAIFQLTDSLLVMVYLLVPAWVGAAVVMTWIAQRKS